MIVASFLLLIGLSGLLQIEGDVMAQAAASACPTAASTAAAQNLKNGEQRARAILPARPNDITETLRAMSLMRIGSERAPEQRSRTN
jgi:hypothetical protein